jgi:hypothetical protein
MDALTCIRKILEEAHACLLSSYLALPPLSPILSPNSWDLKRLRKPICENFGGFFHPIKVCQQKGRQDSIQAVCRTNEEIRGFLYEAAKKNFERFSKTYIC